jgi:hypothetical protein
LRAPVVGVAVVHLDAAGAAAEEEAVMFARDAGSRDELGVSQEVGVPGGCLVLGV